MESGHIRLEIEGGIGTITLARPEKKNALTVKMYEDLVAALWQAEDDKAARVLLVRAEGDVFTAGNDLADFMNTPPAGPESPVFQLLLTLVDLKTPILAAVNGAAVGIGTTMLLHFDLVYAARRARFHLPFVNLGLCPEGGSSLLLPRMMGLPKASELLLFGDPIGAKEAERRGLVAEVFDDDKLEEEARRKAEALAQKPAASLRATKELLRAPLKERVKEALHAEAAVFLERLRSPEATEAFTAFFEKRMPDFSRFD